MISQFLIYGIIAGSIYSLAAIGFNLVYRAVKFFHIAHGGIIAVGAYSFYLFFEKLKLGIITSLALSIAIGILLIILIEFLAYKGLRIKRAPSLIFFISSFGVYIAIQSIIEILAGSQIRTINFGMVQEGHSFLGARITDHQILIIIINILLILLLNLLLKYTKIGIAIRALSDNIYASRIVGINIDKTILYIFLLSSIIGICTGILVGVESNLGPSMGMNIILKGVIAAIIGGMGSLNGAFVGGLLLGIIENLGILVIPSVWKDTISFALLIIFLLIRPGGIFAVKLRIEET
ncbi:MAG: branched-chain amino acid ABC transporter permease [Candidatus Eremiobacteraeota bacterium]|nr:branched-chain amino acid ABC transporter permease [Candidatus Eremiobacteraeota bacterium]